VLSPQQEKKVLEELISFEFDQIRYDVAEPDCYAYLQGRIPILISAPHGAKHYRQNRWKGEDEYTSSLAVVLGRLTGAHVLYTKCKTPEDPNHDGKARYKPLLAKIVRDQGIRFLLDLHGSNPRRPFKVDVGIHAEKKEESSCPSYMEIIRSVFSDFQSPLFNRYFPARGKGTITSFCRKELGIEAAQFEISGRYRIVRRKPDSSWAKAGGDPDFRAEEMDVLDLLSRMVSMIHRIHQKMKKGKVRPRPSFGAYLPGKD